MKGLKMVYREVLRRKHEEGCYGFKGYSALALREDGKRWKMEEGGFRWQGNQGGYVESATFGDLQAARRFWRSRFQDYSEESEEEFFSTALLPKV